MMKNVYCLDKCHLFINLKLHQLSFEFYLISFQTITLLSLRKKEKANSTFKVHKKKH